MFHNKRPLILLFVMVVGSRIIVQQSVGIFSAFASESSPYDSGYDHGCDDAGISDAGDRYINQAGKGPSFHTEEFMSGYDAGFNSCRGGGFNEPQPDFDKGPSGRGETRRGGIDWNAACQVAHTFLNLQTPCDELVTPNNELTETGKQVLACYLGGALGPLLAPGAATELYALGRMICPK